MASESIDGPVPGMTPVGGVQGASPSDMTLEQLLAQDRDASTLSPSQAEVLDQAKGAGIPLLSMPWPMAMEMLNYLMLNGGSDATNFIASIENKYSEIKSDIWDKYIDYLQEEADRRKAYMNSPSYQLFVEQQSPSFQADLERQGVDMMVTVRTSQQYIDFLSTLPKDKFANEIALTKEFTLTTNLINAATHYDNRTSAVAFGAFTLAALAIPALASLEGAANFPVPGAEIAQVLPPALQDSALLTVNLFVQMAALPTAAQTGMLAMGGAKGDLGREHAVNYAQAILKYLGKGVSKSTQIDAMMKEMAGMLEGVEDGAIIAKIILIAPALAMLYNTGVGWNAGDEFLGVLKGMADFEGQGPEEASLAGLLRGYLDMLPPELREKTVNALRDYFSKKPSMKELSNPMRVLNGVLAADPGGEIAA